MQQEHHPYPCDRDGQFLRVLEGEEIEDMSLTDLVQLEQLLYAKLGHIRNTKTRRMIETMSVLQEKVFSFPPF